MIIDFNRELFYEIGQHMICDTLLNSRACGLTNIYLSAAVDGKHDDILTTLDQGYYADQVLFLKQDYSSECAFI